MLTVEEYIARRKSEDRLDEFNLDARLENLKLCTNYLFEYFTHYVDAPEEEERTVLHDAKLDKYRKSLHQHSPEVIEWLVNIYAEYGNHMNRTISNIIKGIDLFLLYSADSEFRSLAYDCHAQLISKYPFAKGRTDYIYRYVKEYHQAQSECGREWTPSIAHEINMWIDETWAEYHVNLDRFCSEWVSSFFDDIESWPLSHRLKSKDPFWKYQYNYKQSSNLFNLDSLYRKMPKKPFIKGRKQEFEIVMMYHWTHSIETDADYWAEYASKTLPAIQQN